MEINEALLILDRSMDGASGCFKSAWATIRKELVEGQKPTTNIASRAIAQELDAYCKAEHPDSADFEVLDRFVTWLEQQQA